MPLNPLHMADVGTGSVWRIAPQYALLLLGLGSAYLTLLFLHRRSQLSEPGIGGSQHPQLDSEPHERVGSDGHQAKAHSWDGPRYPALFLVGLGTLAAALGGPVEIYSDDALSFHMIQHLILLQVAPLLIVLARPLRLATSLLSNRISDQAIYRIRRLQRVVSFMRSPWLVGIVFNLNLMLWHLPPAYDAALTTPRVHALEHLSFLVTGLAFWALVIDATSQEPPHSEIKQNESGIHAAFALCFASCMAGMLIALSLTFAAEPLYPWYRMRGDHPMGLSTLDDQRLGGLIMFAGGIAYFALLMGLLYAHSRPGRSRMATESG